MTFLKTRYAAPIRRAITLTSPMVPGMFPIRSETRSTSPPALRYARGVAPETPSTTFVAQGIASTEKSVMGFAKEIRRKHLAARAGFMKFCPSPP